MSLDEKFLEESLDEILFQLSKGLNFLEINSGPLSVRILLGLPCISNSSGKGLFFCDKLKIEF
jgi:hypothetical protein